MSAPLSLATRALRGFLWNGSASVIQLGVMLALYKLLPLEKLGHFEWALALVMLLSLVGDLGLGAALVQLPDASEEHFDTAFWTCLSWGLLLTAAVVRRRLLARSSFGGRRPAHLQPRPAHALLGDSLRLIGGSVAGQTSARPRLPRRGPF